MIWIPYRDSGTECSSVRTLTEYVPPRASRRRSRKRVLRTLASAPRASWSSSECTNGPWKMMAVRARGSRPKRNSFSITPEGARTPVSRQPRLPRSVGSPPM